MSALIDGLQPETVVCLGDSFHDRTAVERLPQQERAEIERLTSVPRFVWIAGNHDPAPPPDGWGDVAEEIADSPLIFRHEAMFGLAEGRSPATSIRSPRSPCTAAASAGAAS